MTGILIMVNNYFHDVATALLVSSAFVMWNLGKEIRSVSETRVSRLFCQLLPAGNLAGKDRPDLDHPGWHTQNDRLPGF